MFTPIRDDQEPLENKIRREYNILKRNQHRIVLTDDFFALAVKPAIDDGRALEAVFGRAARGLERRMLWLVEQAEVPTFAISYSIMEKQAQERLDTLCQPEVDEAFEQVQNSIEKEITDMLQDGDNEISESEMKRQIEDSEKEFRKFIKSQVMSNKNGVGIHLATIVRAMRSHTNLLSHDGIERFENKSLRRGEGSVALAFWQQVNALHAYNRFFIDPPAPPFDGWGDDNRKPNPLWDWVPGAAKPA